MERVNMRKQAMMLGLIVVVLTGPGARLWAWNYTGHRVVASIAYRELDEPTRRRVAEALRHHPAFEALWANRPTNGPDRALNLFWNASVFPDDARGERWKEYHRGSAHYVNFRIMAKQGNKVEPPVNGENVMNSYVAHLRAIGNPRTSASERALHLSWVFHQAGDIHQPCHAVARFSRAFPEGDRGANGVSFPNPRGHQDWSNNLHAYWDDLLGEKDDPASIERVADELMRAHPRSEFADDLKRTHIEQWAEESLAAALKYVYHNLDPEQTKFTDAPIGYEADALRIGRRRAALAGYRLADELKRLFANP